MSLFYKKLQVLINIRSRKNPIDVYFVLLYALNKFLLLISNQVSFIKKSILLKKSIFYQKINNCKMSIKILFNNSLIISTF